MFEQYDDMLTLEDVCRAMKIGKNAAYDLLKTGRIKSIRNGRTWIVPKRALEAYVMKESGLDLIDPMVQNNP